MSDIFKLIPDIHFDWYARFLPGWVGILAFLKMNEDCLEFYSSNLLLCAIVAYVIGHFAQSPSRTATGLNSK